MESSEKHRKGCEKVIRDSRRGHRLTVHTNFFNRKRLQKKIEKKSKKGHQSKMGIFDWCTHDQEKKGRKQKNEQN